MASVPPAAKLKAAFIEIVNFYACEIFPALHPDWTDGFFKTHPHPMPTREGNSGELNNPGIAILETLTQPVLLADVQPPPAVQQACAQTETFGGNSGESVTSAGANGPG